MKNSTLQYVLPLLALIMGLSVYVLFNINTAYDAETVSGEKIVWQQKKGKWLVVNFFAQWCAPCLREIPELNRFNQGVSENTEVYMVSFDALDKATLQRIIEQYTIEVPVIVTNTETALPVAYPAGLPATYIISPNGQIKEEILGEVKADQLNALLSQHKSAFDN
ncbi:TlpA family protein disulfide reductase [Alteromonas sediminis]|uniref:TlpA family protein disulfide reductase n=1 Tax=Alteromonas sediminis TaxID=2259342 RepID=A0A3N5YD85_9ALTE|nr:TlpA disulfide reductase family protein [Alteromonas sediminis]RPJ67465.1 TlpA family protein disulfide reductase [Alteromonas sediminis]